MRDATGRKYIQVYVVPQSLASSRNISVKPVGVISCSILPLCESFNEHVNDHLTLLMKPLDKKSARHSAGSYHAMKPSKQEAHEMSPYIPCCESGHHVVRPDIANDSELALTKCSTA